MSERLTRGEYWLLESVVLFRIQLECVFRPDDDLSQALNKRGHGMSAEETLDALACLIDRRWLEIDCGSSDSDWEGGHTCPFPSRSELVYLVEKAIRDRHGPFCPYYGLTPAGGQAWESFARPNWRRYIDQSRDYAPDYEWSVWEISGWDHKEVRWALDSFVQEGHELRRDELVWRELVPWQATYWKFLPRGVSVQASFRELPWPDPLSMEARVREGARQERSFRDRAWYSWR